MAPLRYLARADVEMSAPAMDEQLELAKMALLAVEGGAVVPAKIAVPLASPLGFLRAMPAFVDRDANGARPAIAGLKWIATVPHNKLLGLPAISGLIVLNDGETGLPTAVMEAQTITAMRTAAVSGVAISELLPAASRGGTSVGLIGAGTQGRSHVKVVAHLLDDFSMRIYDPHADRAEALARAALESGARTATVAESPKAAVQDASLVITAAAFSRPKQVMSTDWINSAALIAAVDHATYVSSEVARSASVFLVDDMKHFLDALHAEPSSIHPDRFEGYPVPSATIGRFLLDGQERPSGTVLFSHLGLASVDILFADAVMRSAAINGLGVGLQS